MFQHVTQIEMTLPLLGPAFANGEQPGQPGISGTVPWQRDPVHGAVAQDQPTADRTLSPLKSGSG